MFISRVLVICFALMKAVSCEEISFQGENGIRYIIEENPEFSWDEAKAACEKKNSRLATINENNKYLNIMDIMKTNIEYVAAKFFWVGASSDASTWITEGNLDYNVFYDNTHEEEELPKSCLLIQYRKLITADCNHRIGYLCEQDTRL